MRIRQEFGEEIREARPDDDGYLTLEEVNEWYKNGKGKPLFADLSKIDFSGISLKDFGSKNVKVFNLLHPDFFSNLNDALVYGSLTLTLESENAVIASPDRYNFEMHSFNSIMRNIGTLIGNYVAGLGDPFDIYFYNIGTIGQ